MRGLGASRYEAAEEDLPLIKLAGGDGPGGGPEDQDGLLLARKGYEVTDSFVTRARAYGRSNPDGTLKVFVLRTA